MNVNATRFFSYALSLSALFILVIMVEQSLIVTNMPTYMIKPFSLVEMLIFITISLSLASATIIYLKPKLNLGGKGKWLLIGLAFILIYSTINLWLTPLAETFNFSVEGKPYNFIFHITVLDKIKAFLVLLANIGIVFILIFLIPRIGNFKIITNLTFIGFIIFAYSALLYSLYFERAEYALFWTNNFLQTEEIVSFLGNRNPYASYLLTGIFALFYFLNFTKKKALTVLLVALIIPLFLGIHLTFSKTNIILSYLFLLIVFLRHYINVFKRNKSLFILETAFIVVLFSFLILLLFTNLFSSLPLLVKFKNFIVENLFHNSDFSLDSRKRLRDYALAILTSNVRVFFFGSGPYLSRVLYESFVNNFAQTEYLFKGDYHNGFIEIFHTFGLLGLLIYAAALLSVVIFAITKLKTNKTLGWLVLMNVAFFLLRAHTESFAALLFKSEAIITSSLFVFPFLLLNAEEGAKKHQERKIIIKQQPLPLLGANHA